MKYFKLILSFSAGFFAFSAFVYTFTDHSDKWFSRVFLALMCVGFLATIRVTSAGFLAVIDLIRQINKGK